MEPTFDFPTTISRLGPEKQLSHSAVCVAASTFEVYKLQYIDERFKTRPELITEFEISREIKALKDESARADLLNINAFFSFSGATALTPMARFRLQKTCDQFYRRISTEGWGTGMLNIISMERAPETLDDLYDRKVEFTESFTKRLITQLVLGLRFLRARLGFIHGDLKPDNILVFGNPPDYKFKFFDFGTSSTTSIRANQYYAWLVPPIIFFETDIDQDLKKSVLSRNQEGDDVWALGLLILQLAVKGLDVREFDHMFKTPTRLVSPDRPQLLAYQTLLDVTPQSECFENLVDEIMFTVNEERGYASTFQFVKHLLLICQIQNYLGNGFVPKSDAKYNQYFVKIAEKADDILDSNRRKPGQDLTCADIEEGDTWGYEVATIDTFLAKVNEANDDDPNTNIFELFVETLRLKFGDDGVDFVRRCLQWKTDERRRFWDKEREFRDFDALLEHPFLHCVG